jgi:hypothetical protein
MDDSKPLSIPISTTTALGADEDEEPVDQKEYRSIIGSLLYLTATRLDIRFFCVSVHSFSSVIKDFTSAGHQADLQISSIHS